MKRQTVLATALAAVFFCLSAPSWLTALTLEPLSHNFDTSTSGRVRTFRVSNTQDKQIAVRIRMTTRDLLPNGEETREAADNHWLVFPRQLTLQPGASQAVRVQYTGPVGIETEKAYRIIAEQLPVDFSGQERQTSGISMLFRYEGSVYVQPPRAVPEVILADTLPQYDEERFLGILVRFENRGTAHAILNDLTIRVIRSDATGNVLGTLEFPEEELPVAGGTNLLAGRALEEFLELPPEWGQGELSVQYEVELVQ